MQVAAHAARQGHGKLAQELRELIDTAKGAPRRGERVPHPVVQPRGELAGPLSVSYPKTRLSDMVLEPKLQARLERILLEQRQREKLLTHGLAPRRKILLVGPPGTGKTLTARVLAGELSQRLFTILLDGIITRFMGETAAKLRLVFDALQHTRGVYLFDEFDALGSHRTSQNDIGEIRRVLNSFFQFLEQDETESLIIAATNQPEFASAPGFDLALQSFNVRSAGIEMVTSRTLAGVTYATVYVPKGQLGYFEKNVEEYLTERAPRGNPKNRPLIESIAEILSNAPDRASGLGQGS
ncbi:ATP-binding protein [Sorangium sp. So ce426]